MLTKLFFAAAFVLIASCNKPYNEPEGSEMTITAVNPQFRTSTSDGVNVLWNNGDQIAIFAGENTSKSAVFRTGISQASTSATFALTGDVQPVKQGDTYQAIFPSSQLYTWNSAGNKACAVDLPFKQTVSGPGWDQKASIMAASSADRQFVFNHCVAYIRFSITKDSPDVVSFSVTGGGDELVASRVTVVIPDDNAVTVTEKTPASTQSQTVTLTMENGGSFPQGTYYLAILPKTYSDGLAFIATDKDGNTYGKEIKSELVMSMGAVGVVGAVQRNGIGASIDPLRPFDIFKMTRVGILGDSISTFEGYIPAEYDAEDAAYYPKENTSTGIKVDNVNQTYWHKLIYDRMSNAVLAMNNSWRGTMVTRRDNEAFLNMDFCARFRDKGLGNPDVIIVHGGTNDVGKYSEAHAQAGQYKIDIYPGVYGMAPETLPTDAQFQSVFDAADAATTWEEAVALEDLYFIPAYVKLITMIHIRYPEAKVVFIIGDYVTKRCWQAMVKILDYYGDKYGYRYVDLYDMTDAEKARLTYVSKPHPDDGGFTFMADKIYAEVGDYIENK
ncbi:MAG: hypothetical protein E7111_05875 [Bacteroidales bacterium]|nr:hypothetical protein [Bacteroidales bacterium]